MSKVAEVQSRVFKMRELVARAERAATTEISVLSDGDLPYDRRRKAEERFLTAAWVADSTQHEIDEVLKTLK